MIALLAILNLFLSLGLLYILYKWILQQGLGVSTVSLLVIVLTNVIGLSFMPFVLEGGKLNTGNIALPFDPDAYVRQVLSTSIFLLASYGFVCFSPRRLRLLAHPAMKRRNHLVTWIVGTLMFLIGLGLWAKYMLYGVGLSLALSTRFDYFDFSLAAAHRAEVRQGLQVGQGYYRALVASFSVFPLSVAVLRLLGRRNVYFLAVWALGLTLSMLFAISMRQKAPPLMMILCYGGIIAAGKLESSRIWQRLAKWMNWRILLVGLSAIILVCTLFYLITEGETFAVNMQKTIGRIFVTPCASAHLWYIVFPSQLPFRGIPGVFFISPFSADSSSVTVQDISFESTGALYSANASFLAMGWSGWGYLGVALSTAALLLILRLMDNFTASLFGLPRILVFCLLIPAFVILTSSAWLDIIGIGSVPAVIAFVIFLRIRPIWISG